MKKSFIQVLMFRRGQMKQFYKLMNPCIISPTYSKQRYNMINPSQIFHQTYSHQDQFHYTSNKQNINSKNMQKSDEHPQLEDSVMHKKHDTLQKLQILKESALQVIAQKNIIIENLLRSQPSFVSTIEDSEIIQELQQKIMELHAQKSQLKQFAEQLTSKLDKQRDEWNRQHFKLMQHIDFLKEELQKMEDFIEQCQQKSHVLHQLNAELSDQLLQAKMAYKLIKEDAMRDEEQFLADKSQSGNSRNLIIPELSIYGKVDGLFNQSSNIIPSQNIITERQKESQQKYHDTLSYQTQEWFIQQSRQISIENNQHCLQKSLQAIKLIENYSMTSKNNLYSDCESQFTQKYFKYPTDHILKTIEKTAQNSCEHIPQEPDEQFQISQHKIMNQQSKYSFSCVFQKVGYVFGGMIIGGLAVWKLIK